MRPLPPYDLRQGVARGLAGQGSPLHAYGESLVEELLDVGLDDNREDGRGLHASSVVFCNAGVLPGVSPLKLECSQGAGGLIKLPAWKIDLRKHVFIKSYLRGFCCLQLLNR